MLDYNNEMINEMKPFAIIYLCTPMKFDFCNYKYIDTDYIVVKAVCGHLWHCDIAMRILKLMFRETRLKPQ